MANLKLKEPGTQYIKNYFPSRSLMLPNVRHHFLYHISKDREESWKYNMLKLCAQLWWSIKTSYLSLPFKCMIFHIFICILLLPCVYYELTMWPGLMTQLEEHCTGMAKVLVWIPFSPEFFPLEVLISQLLNWVVCMTTIINNDFMYLYLLVYNWNIFRSPSKVLSVFH